MRMFLRPDIQGRAIIPVPSLPPAVAASDRPKNANGMLRGEFSPPRNAAGMVPASAERLGGGPGGLPMPTSPEGFARRLNRLKADLVDQGRRVQSLIEAAFDTAFSRDTVAAQRVVAQDEVIDRVDLDIERASVSLLTDATREHAA